MADDRDLSAESVDIEGMRETLQSQPITFALLFGSTARNESETSSDVDIALEFPESTDDRGQFRQRNRIDAALQEYATGFVDVSDIDTLALPVAYAALRDGVPTAGNEDAVEAFRKRTEAECESTADQRQRNREAFIDRLASGDT